MSAPDRYRGGGWGEIEPPGTVAADYAAEWDVRCFAWSGGRWWTAQRREPVPEDPPAFGVRNRFAGWSSQDRMRIWLEAQAEALKRRTRLRRQAWGPRT